MIKYALRHKKSKELLDFSTHGVQDPDCSVDVEFSLSRCCSKEIPSNVWMTDFLDQAKRTRSNPSEWYNAEYETPSHEYKHNELEIVEIEINIKKK